MELKQASAPKSQPMPEKIYWNEAYLKEQLRLGKNYLNIARENNIGKSTAQRALKHFGLTVPRLGWSTEEIGLLGKHYGKTAVYSRYFPNRGPSSVYHKANRLGIRNHIKPRKYSVDETFFERWSEEMAYVLGWLFSDGNVTAKREFRLKLAVKDKEILEKISSALSSGYPITIMKQLVPSRKYMATYALMRICSSKMCNDLIKLGCVPNKMHKFRMPEMPPRFLRHFIRGYFDGDGSIMFNRPNVIKLSFVGSNEQFMSNLAEVLHKELKIPSNFKKTGKNLWASFYYGDNARRICFWMYEDCGNLFLARKKNRFVGHLRKRPGVSYV